MGRRMPSAELFPVWLKILLTMAGASFVVLLSLTIQSGSHERVAQQPSEDSGAAIGALVLILVSAATYFIPSIVGRKKRNATAIFALNLFLGWTVVGWVVALVWALTREDAVSAPAAVGGLLCRACGRYSAPASAFCSSCGAPIG